MSRDIDTLDRRLLPYAAALLQVAQGKAPGAFVTSARRSRTEQSTLYANYKAGRSQYPAAHPGNSKHERGLAFDIGGVPLAKLRKLGKLWESWGGRWGGRFRDPIHFESFGR